MGSSNSIQSISLWRAPKTEAITSLGKNILESFSSLVSSLEPSVQQRFRPLLTELEKEKDDSFLLHGLLQVGVRLKSEHQEIPAQAILERLSQGDVPEEIRGKAAQEYGAMVGTGAFGMRAEYLGSRLAKDFMNGQMIAPMLGATMVGQVAGTAVLGRLLGSASRGFLTRGFGARLAAGTASYLVEFPAFASLSRAVSPASDVPLSDTFASSALTLGAIRVFSGLGAKIPLPIVPRPSFLQIGSTFLGLLAANKLEQHFNLRPSTADNATTAIDTLGSMLGLLIGANLGNRFLGPAFVAFRREMELRADFAAKLGDAQKSFGEQFVGARRFAPAGTPTETFQVQTIKPKAGKGLDLFAMVAQKGESRVFNRKDYPHVISKITEKGGATLSLKLFSKEPIADAGRVAAQLGDDFLALLISGQEINRLQGTIASRLREDPNFRAFLLDRPIEKVDLQFDVNAREILTLRIFKDGMRVYLSASKASASLFGPAKESRVPAQVSLFNTTLDTLPIKGRAKTLIIEWWRLSLIGELVQLKEWHFLKQAETGPKTLAEVQEILRTRGLSLGMKVGSWRSPNQTDNILEILNRPLEDIYGDFSKKGWHYLGDLARMTENEFQAGMSDEPILFRDACIIMFRNGLLPGMGVKNWKPPIHSEALKFNTPLDQLPLQGRARALVDYWNLRVAGELARLKEWHFQSRQNIGRKTVHNFKRALESIGLSLGTDVGSWRPPHQSVPTLEILNQPLEEAWRSRGNSSAKKTKRWSYLGDLARLTEGELYQLEDWGLILDICDTLIRNHLVPGMGVRNWQPPKK